MSLLLANFRAIYPEFTDTSIWPDALVDARLQMAQRQTNPLYFDSQARADDAQGLLTAHLLLIGLRTNGATRVSAGSASVQYPTWKRSLQQTLYGQEYERIIRLTGGPRLMRWPM